MSKQNIRFPDLHKLSMNSISHWVGHKIAERGVQYQRDNMVKDIYITEDGFIIADVDGSELYSVAVSRNDAGQLQSFCTCPYGIDCKHGVAALLEYVSRLQKNKGIPQIADTDPRLQLLHGANISFGNEQSTEALAHVQVTLQKQLSTFTKQQLIEKICHLAQDIPKVHAFFQDERQNSQKDAFQLLKTLRKEIQKATNAHIDFDPWADDEDLPDYSKVRNLLRTFLDMGLYDELLAEAQDFLQKGMEQIEFDDDGEVIDEVASCLDLFLVALQKSHWSMSQKLIWTLNMIFLDEFDLCEEYEDFLQENFPVSAWNEAIIYLQAKLQKMTTGKMLYMRDSVAHWYVHALEQTGRDNEILPFYATEVQITHDYLPLVQHLMREEKFAEALRWIDTACKDTKANTKLSMHSIKQYRREIYEKQEVWASLLLLDVQSFLEDPSFSSFTSCKKTAEKASLWNPIREILLNYLAKGVLPWEHAHWPKQLEPPTHTKSLFNSVFPDIYNLIHIAMLENDVEAVQYWYSKMPKGTNYDKSFYDAIANTLQKDYPKMSIFLWQQLTQNCIALANKNAYIMAIGYLRKARTCMLAQNLEQDWNSFLLNLKKQHARKKNFIALLATLDEKPLLPEN